MIDQVALHLALRGRLLTLVAVTTGAQTLAATSTGYTRASGSFLTDGFAEGMEITPAGFPSNPIDMVVHISTDGKTITTRSAHSAAVASSGRSLAVKVPSRVAWDDVPLQAEAGWPMLAERFEPTSYRGVTMPISQGQREQRGFYVLTYYGPEGTGATAIRRFTHALIELFDMGTTIAVGSGRVRVTGDPGPTVSGIINSGTGHARSTVEIPWFARSYPA